MARNIYRLDDVLRRIGIGLLFVAAFFFLKNSASLWARVAVASLPGLGAWALLWIARRLHQRERRILAVWDTLDRMARAKAEDVAHSLGMERDEVIDAVRLINERTDASFVIEAGTDRITDARLHAEIVTIGKCQNCGANISLEVTRAAATEVVCPYCHAKPAPEVLQPSRQPLAPLASASSADETRHFSLGTFFLLTLVFWPAGLWYAFSHGQLIRLGALSGGARTTGGRITRHG